MSPYAKRRDRMMLTQSQVATLLGVSRPTVALWERGSHHPQAHALLLYRAMGGADRDGPAAVDQLRAGLLAIPAKARKLAETLNREADRAILGGMTILRLDERAACAALTGALAARSLGLDPWGDP